ncbi:transposase [uncultured Draconibacterium sp.]|uniref:transposase n=1 Tax=uncultured Draconibacterium sp. TaxID=1573823 RepID=UPI0029C0901B|nr:transposase [uncultured Draconibacterium sp.]
MVRRRFNKNQIIEILQKYEEGASIQSLIKEHGISLATFYNWKAKYSKSKNYNKQELLKLKEDYERLSRMFAELSLENMRLKAKLENSK